MLTPQEVSTHSFSKASFGGYNMAMVDEFLDELTDDYTALYKENAALKAKLKVLVEKVEEYRATEDSMRATLLTAQRMADSIVKEAEQKRDQMMTQAEIDAKAEDQPPEKGGCRRTRSVCARGRRNWRSSPLPVRAVCDKEIQLLEQLPQLPVEAAPRKRRRRSPCARRSRSQRDGRVQGDGHLSSRREPPPRRRAGGEGRRSTRKADPGACGDRQTPLRISGPLRHPASIESGRTEIRPQLQ